MKAWKVAAATILSASLLCAMLVAELVALVRFTVLEPEFYGKSGKQAYSIIGQAVVEKMADAVLERAPSIVLRTGDRREALRLAVKALPPEQVAELLEENAPGIAQYVFYGGDLPVLKGSREFSEGMTDVVRNMLMDGVWDMLPDKPSFPAFMPFTPEWNLIYGRSLENALWPVRHYAGLANYALWLVLAAVTLFLGLLYLLWVRQRRGFCATLAVTLALNGLMLAAGAILVSYQTANLAGEAASLYPVSQAAALFEQDWIALFRAASLPFRDILFWGAVATLALAIAAATAGIERAWQPWPWKAQPAQSPAPSAQKRRTTNSRDLGTPQRKANRGKGPRHAKRTAGIQAAR